ncbi:MAG: hypothetical protein PVJ28_00005 [Acidimicrobiia bacterium]
MNIDTDHSSAAAPETDELTTPSDSFNDSLEEIRRSYASWTGIEARLRDQVRRRLGVSPAGATDALLAVAVGVGIRLGLVLAATALVGQWSGLPWAAWAVIFAFYGLVFAFESLAFPPPEVPAGPWVKRKVEEWTALLPRIERESDLRDMAAFMRRNADRLAPEAGVGLVVAAVMFSAAWQVAPTAMNELPAGSVVLLAILLYDFGATPIYGGIIGNWIVMAREARYDHHLFWPSPADTPEVQTAIRTTNDQGLTTAIWITLFFGLSIVLVSWDSPLVLPLGAGFIVFGYVATFVAAFKNRASIHRIVQHAREQRLQGLQHRIDGFGPRYTDLTPQESDQLRDLVFLYDKIRDAPTTPTTTRTAIHTAAGLIIPTLLFIATVFGEVYTERFFDAILP